MANVEEGSTVAVFGLGAVGLAAAEGARLRGAAKIIGVDLNPDKFELGKVVLYLYLIFLSINFWKLLFFGFFWPNWFWYLLYIQYTEYKLLVGVWYNNNNGPPPVQGVLFICWKSQMSFIFCFGINYK